MFLHYDHFPWNRQSGRRLASPEYPFSSINPPSWINHLVFVIEVCQSGGFDHVHNWPSSTPLCRASPSMAFARHLFAKFSTWLLHGYWGWHYSLILFTNRCHISIRHYWHVSSLCRVEFTYSCYLTTMSPMESPWCSLPLLNQSASDGFMVEI